MQGAQNTQGSALKDQVIERVRREWMTIVPEEKSTRGEQHMSAEGKSKGEKHTRIAEKNSGAEHKMRG